MQLAFSLTSIGATLMLQSGITAVIIERNKTGWFKILSAVLLLGLPFALLLGMAISFNRVRGAIVERNAIAAQIADRKSQLVTGEKTIWK